MPKTVELDTFLVTLKVPRELPRAAVAKVRKALDRPQFRVRLRRSVAAFLKQLPDLRTVTVAISR